MKSSFSWPGRPPAEMISRNANRLLTSTLDGTPKRGAFCTSTLDGTPKRGTFCTSTLDGTPKRGAFCTSILDATPKRGTFYTSTLDGRLKRDAFLCTKVGAYCIRPTFSTIRVECTQIRSTKRPCKGTGSTKGDQTHDSLSPTGPFGRAYAIRPYHATSKRDAFCLFHLSRNTETRCVFMYPGRGVLHTPHQTFPQGDGICKRRPNARLFVPYGAIRWGVCNTPLPATSKRDAFASSFSIVVFSSFIFLCLSSLFSSGRSSFRCSVMCAP